MILIALVYIQADIKILFTFFRKIFSPVLLKSIKGYSIQYCMLFSTKNENFYSD